jgi:hypothetical protein
VTFDEVLNMVDLYLDLATIEDRNRTKAQRSVNFQTLRSSLREFIELNSFQGGLQNTRDKVISLLYHSRLENMTPMQKQRLANIYKNLQRQTNFDPMR